MRAIHQQMYRRLNTYIDKCSEGKKGTKSHVKLVRLGVFRFLKMSKNQEEDTGNLSLSLS